MSQNLVKNPTFSGTPDGWEFSAPREEIATGHSIKDGPDGRRLVLSATGDKHAFSSWVGEADMELGGWYRASVKVKTKDVANPVNSVFAQVGQHLLLPTECPNGGTICLQREFPILTEFEGKRVQLFMRATETGEIEYFEPHVEKIARPKHRMARVATTRFGHPPSLDGVDMARVWNTSFEDKLTLEGQRQRIAAKLDEAGKCNPDIVCLPEFSHTLGVDAKYIQKAEDHAEEAGGPLCQVLSAKAKEYGMYVIAGLVIRDGKHMFNTAVLFDRKGDMIGQYRKTHPMFGEMEIGLSIGDSYPVFDLDFGKIAIHICYDEWIPEVSRYYAHQGAEILFLPVAGGKPITWRTRALDNGIYFVSSSINPPSMIINSSGDIITQTHGDGVVYADLNLDFRATNWYGDPTLSYGMPCQIPQMRYVVDDFLVNEIGKKLKDAWR